MTWLINEASHLLTGIDSVSKKPTLNTFSKITSFRISLVTIIQDMVFVISTISKV